MSNLFAHKVCSLWPIKMTLSVAITLGQSGSGCNGNEGVLHIPQISKAGDLPLDCLMSYLGHLLEREVLILQSQPNGLTYCGNFSLSSGKIYCTAWNWNEKRSFSASGALESNIKPCQRAPKKEAIWKKFDGPK